MALDQYKKDIAVKVSKLTKKEGVAYFAMLDAVKRGSDPYHTVAKVNAGIAMLIIKGKLRFAEEVAPCPN